MNLHHLANMTQVKLFSEEEVTSMSKDEELKGNLGL